MISLLLLGTFIGTAIAALEQPIRGISVLRYALLATVGATIGKLAYEFIHQTYGIDSQILQAITVFVLAVMIVLIRKWLKPAKYLRAQDRTLAIR